MALAASSLTDPNLSDPDASRSSSDGGKARTRAGGVFFLFLLLETVVGLRSWATLTWSRWFSDASLASRSAASFLAGQLFEMCYKYH
jgi:hypothetical protein